MRLELEGFSAYRAPAVVDFEGVDLSNHDLASDVYIAHPEPLLVKRLSGTTFTETFEQNDQRASLCTDLVPHFVQRLEQERRARNTHYKSTMRTFIKRVRAAVARQLRSATTEGEREASRARTPASGWSVRGWGSRPGGAVCCRLRRSATRPRCGMPS